MLRNKPRSWHQRGRRGARSRANQLAQTARQTGWQTGEGSGGDGREKEVTSTFKRRTGATAAGDGFIGMQECTVKCMISTRWEGFSGGRHAWCRWEQVGLSHRWRETWGSGKQKEAFHHLPLKMIGIGIFIWKTKSYCLTPPPPGVWTQETNSTIDLMAWPPPPPPCWTVFFNLSSYLHLWFCFHVSSTVL